MGLAVLLRERDVPGILRRDYPDEGTHFECHCHGKHQRNIGLYTNIRQIRSTAPGIGGSCDCLGHGGGGFVALLPALHAVCGGREKVRAQVPLASRFPGHQAHSERFRIHDAATIHSLHHVVCILPRHRTHRATGTCHCQCGAEHLRPCPDTGAGALDNGQYISQQCHWFKSH